MKLLTALFLILAFSTNCLAGRSSIHKFIKSFNKVKSDDCSSVRIYNTGRKNSGQIVFKAKKDGAKVRLVMDPEELTQLRGVATLDRFAESSGSDFNNSFKERLELRQNSEGEPEQIIYTKHKNGDSANSPEVEIVCNYL